MSDDTCYWCHGAGRVDPAVLQARAEKQVGGESTNELRWAAELGGWRQYQQMLGDATDALGMSGRPSPPWSEVLMRMRAMQVEVKCPTLTSADKAIAFVNDLGSATLHGGLPEETVTNLFYAASTLATEMLSLRRWAERAVAQERAAFVRYMRTAPTAFALIANAALQHVASGVERGEHRVTGNEKGPDLPRT